MRQLVFNLSEENVSIKLSAEVKSLILKLLKEYGFEKTEEYSNIVNVLTFKHKDFEKKTYLIISVSNQGEHISFEFSEMTDVIEVMVSEIKRVCSKRGYISKDSKNNF